MRYRTATAFRMALERRLLTRSQSSGLNLSRLRKLVVFERLLARLLIVAPEHNPAPGSRISSISC